MSNSIKPRYRADIDGLRAIAVLLVLAFHFKIETFRAGFCGVDVFFVISGFLITGTSLSRLSSWRDVADFYRRRIARLLPLSTVTILATLIASYFLFAPSEARAVDTTAPSVALFYANVFFWKKFGYFQITAETNPFLHMWSLGVEEQFYAFIPIALLLTRRPVAVLTGLAAISLVLVAAVAKPPGAFYLLPCRMWEFAAGALLVYAPAPKKAWQSMLVFTIGLVCLGVALIVLTPDYDQSPLWRILPVAAAVSIVWAGGQSNALSRVLGFKPFAGLGARSYSIYLLHLPLWIFIAVPSERRIDGTFQFAMLVLDIVVGALAFALIERPAQTWLRKFSFKRVVAFAVVAIGISLLLAEALARATPSPPSLPHFAEDSERCFLGTTQEASSYDIQNCVPKTSNEKWIIYGDSFAAHYLFGLREALKPNGIDVFQATNAGCAPFRKSRFERCENFSRFVLDDLIVKTQPTTIVLASRWERSLDELGLDGAVTAIDEIVKELKGRGLRVILVDQSPQFFADVPAVLQRRRVMRREVRELRLPAKTYREFNLALRNMGAKEGVEVFSFSDSICGADEMCFVTLEGKALFNDRGHLTREGSTLAAAGILKLKGK